MKNLFKRWWSSQEIQKTVKRLARNIAANEVVAKKEFPHETWIRSDNIKMKYEKMPDGAEGIIIAKSKLPTNPTEERDLIKEINQELY